MFQSIAAFTEVQSHAHGFFFQVIQHGTHIQSFSGQVYAGILHPVVSADFQIIQINGFVDAGI